MHKALTIARREYKATIRTKGFIIGLVLAPFLMGGSGLTFALLKDRVDTTDKRVVILDHSSRLAEGLLATASERNAKHTHDEETGKKLAPLYLLEALPPEASDSLGQRLELSERIRSNELHAFLVLGESIVHPGENPEGARISFYARNPAIDEVRSWLSSTINGELRRLRLEDAGVEKVPDLFHWISVDGLGLVSRASGSGEIKHPERKSRIEALLIPIVLPILLFVMLLMGAVPLIGAVVEEKVQRIAEVVLGSMRPFDFMLGKLIGGCCVSLTAAGVYVVVAVAVVNYLELGQYIPYHILPWFFVYGILAIFMYGAFFSALGASCSEQSEVQSIMLPAMLPVLIPMFILMPVATQPLSTFATTLSLLPPFTPMLMLLRMCTAGGVPAWQPWVGLLGILLLTMGLVWAGARIFRIGILMQGMPFHLANVVRWAFRG